MRMIKRNAIYFCNVVVQVVVTFIVICIIEDYIKSIIVGGILCCFQLNAASIIVNRIIGDRYNHGRCGRRLISGVARSNWWRIM